MCKYTSSHVLTTEQSRGVDKSSIVTAAAAAVQPWRLLPAHLRSVCRFTGNRETSKHIRSSQSATGGARHKEKMFQQKLVIVIRTFLLFFLFQPSSLVATTTVDAGEYAAQNELLSSFHRAPHLRLPSTFIYLFSRRSTPHLPPPYEPLIVCRCTGSAKHIMSGGWRASSSRQRVPTARRALQWIIPTSRVASLSPWICTLLFIQRGFPTLPRPDKGCYSGCATRFESGRHRFDYIVCVFILCLYPQSFQNSFDPQLFPCPSHPHLNYF